MNLLWITSRLQHCQWDASLYEKRAACFEAHGEPQKAVADLRAITKLVADSTEHYYKISKLLYAIGDLDESLRYALFSRLPSN
jgi:DnaJ family protein C protein 3